MSKRCPKCGHNPATDHLGMKAEIERLRDAIHAYLAWEDPEDRYGQTYGAEHPSQLLKLREAAKGTT